MNEEKKEIESIVPTTPIVVKTASEIRHKSTWHVLHYVEKNWFFVMGITFSFVLVFFGTIVYVGAINIVQSLISSCAIKCSASPQDVMAAYSQNLGLEYRGIIFLSSGFVMIFITTLYKLGFRMRRVLEPDDIIREEK